MTTALDRLAGCHCLVTGGAGFIGSNLVRALLDLGARVAVVDALYPRHGGDPRNLEGLDVQFIQTDIADHRAVVKVATRAEIIFNLAGQTSHVDSMTNPAFDLDVNTRSQVLFLQMLSEVDPRNRVVFASTRQLFGRPRYLPVDDEHPVDPVDVNGITKYAAEQFHRLFGEVHGLPWVILRLTNVYGPRQRLRGDHLGFLPVFIRRALNGEAIQVFGEGDQLRDCLHVDDVVDCLIRAAVADDAVGEVFTIGHDERLSVREIAEHVIAAAGRGMVDHVPWPEGRDEIDIGSYYADYSKAKRLLGWTPRTSFADGIRRTVDFYDAHRPWYL